MKCSTADHEALKADLTRWTALELIGEQKFDEEDGEPPSRFELRNCACCGSTLCLDVLA